MKLQNYFLNFVIVMVGLSGAVFGQSSTTAPTTVPTTTVPPTTVQTTAVPTTTVPSTTVQKTTVPTTSPPTTPFPDDGYNCTTNGPFPHPIYCEYYYHCSEGVDTLIKCMNNFLFDLRYYGCNWPEQTECQDRERPDGYPTGPPPAGSTTTRDPGSFICPPEDGNYPDPDDCASFFQCYQGVAYRLKCPFPLMFDPVGQVCDHPGAVDCGTRPIPTIRPLHN